MPSKSKSSKARKAASTVVAAQGVSASPTAPHVQTARGKQRVDDDTMTAKAPRERRITHHRIAPLKPASHQTVSNRPSGSGLNNPTREIKGRNIIFVTRKTGLGQYLKRCKGLLVSEGLSHVILHALCAAIPHAMLLLHALLDILPYPKQYVSYEIRTSTTACTDEVFDKRGADDDDGELEPFEEDESQMRTRMKSSLEIVVRVGKAVRTAEDRKNAQQSRKKARPNKVQRAARRRAHQPGDTDIGGPDGVGEEEAMNDVTMQDIDMQQVLGSQQPEASASTPKPNALKALATELNEEDMMNG